MFYFVEPQTHAPDEWPGGHLFGFGSEISQMNLLSSHIASRLRAALQICIRNIRDVVPVTIITEK